MAWAVVVAVAVAGRHHVTEHCHATDAQLHQDQQVILALVVAVAALEAWEAEMAVLVEGLEAPVGSMEEMSEWHCDFCRQLVAEALAAAAVAQVLAELMHPPWQESMQCV